jgi:hypothetical protein
MNETKHKRQFSDNTPPNWLNDIPDNEVPQEELANPLQKGNIFQILGGSILGIGFLITALIVVGSFSDEFSIGSNSLFTNLMFCSAPTLLVGSVLWAMQQRNQ